MTVGVIMPMIALSEVGCDKVAVRRTCLNAGRQKVNQPNVAPMGVTSPRLQSWVVDSDRGGREMTFKLFKVTLRGGINPGSTDYNASFVVAESPDAAYQAVRDFLDNNNLCYDDERELKSIELLAEDREYPACRTMLFLAEALP